MRILVCGSRDWTDAACITLKLGALLAPWVSGPGPHVVIHGDNGDLLAQPPRGADKLAGFVAKELGASVVAYPINHALDGLWPGAGPRRNARMLAQGKPDRGLAFGALRKPHDCTTEGPAHYKCCSILKFTGTGDMVARMLAIGLPVRWIASPSAESVDLTSMPDPKAARSL